jgi:hypothetical protein
MTINYRLVCVRAPTICGGLDDSTMAPSEYLPQIENHEVSFRCKRAISDIKLKDVRSSHKYA